MHVLIKVCATRVHTGDTWLAVKGQLTLQGGERPELTVSKTLEWTTGGWRPGG